MTAFAFIGASILPESPEHLYFYYKFAECKKSIRYIAKFNKKYTLTFFSFDKERELVYLKFTEITP